MRILYLSCHSVLEYDEVLLFHELGHEVFSPGAYINPQASEQDTLRPGIATLRYDPEILSYWHRLAALCPGEDGKDHLTKEFVDLFDIIIVMHTPKWLTQNWPVLKGKRVVWRTIGQSINSVETQLKPLRGEGMQVVRYSPMEANIPSYIGADAFIRFYKDPAEYRDWNGEKEQVINFSQDMQRRNQACNFTLFERTTAIFPRKLYGSGSENLSWGAGRVPFEELKAAMRDSRAYLYTGTHPASYTLNFIEALMTGIPVVAIGPVHGNAPYFPGHNLYEIPNIIQNHYNGFVSDDVRALRYYISHLLANHDMAQIIGAHGRETAIELFGKDTIKQQWEAFLVDNRFRI